MYTEQDLADAMAAKDFKLVSQISMELAKAEPVKKTKSTKARPKTKEVVATPTLPAPNPSDGTSSWMAPSLAGKPKKFDENGKEIFEAVLGATPSLDHTKIRFETDNKPAPGLTAAQKKAEKLKKVPRDFSMNRPPVKKVKVECEGCGKKFSVYPSAMKKREDERSVELYYTCEKCIGPDKRR